MEAIFTFLIKASAGMALFYMVYWFFLKKETFYKANRWFLLLALFFAILLPLFPVKYAVLVEAENGKTVITTIADTFKNIPVVNGTESVGESFNWQQAVLIIYLTGIAIFLFRLLTQTFILVHLMIKYRIKSLDGVRVVENEKYGLPFSFFNIVFINPKFHTQEDLPEILAHEKVHIRENHWFDLLFIELLTVIFWFNPFIWFFERSIKQNHEYLADRGVLAQGHGVGRYQAILLNQLMGMQIIGITNNLNFALNTNRLKMMTKKKTSAKKLIRFIWALPVLAILLYAFAQPDHRTQVVEPVDTEVFVEQPENQETVKLAGLIVDENGVPLPGTSVVIKGTTIGTVADLDGRFELEIPEQSEDVFSCVGKKTIFDSFSGITSDYVENGVYNRKYQMEDVIIGIAKAEKLIPGVNNDESAQPLPPPPPPPPNTFYIVERMSEYPGGSDTLNNFVYKMQQKMAKSTGAKGEAKVLFTVNEEGKVTNVQIVEQDNALAGQNAANIVSSMPDWTFGFQHGKAVPVKYMIPIEFK